jgi:DNA primase
MRLPPSFLEEIKARLPASQVVGRRVKLTKSGREWKGLSPFSRERTPSFFVNDQKQAWFDFSSGKNGNIFTFLMETEGLSFREAVERLAAEAGLDMPKFSAEAEAIEKARAGLHEVCEAAARFFEAELRGTGGGAARDYLDRRGLGLETRATFRLGYAPASRFALRDHLAGAGIDRDLMIEAGLLIHGDDIPVPYDRFRDRVMFPICDQRGRVIAFGGRAMSADVPAKYLNSPETPLFHKGANLYNVHRARKPAHDLGTVIAVEGYVDAIALHTAGFQNVVAPLGTALTEDQLGLLWRLADEPILCFDGDKAGLRAAFRAIDVALPLLAAGKSLRFALLPEGQDPDDLVRAAGRSAVEAVLAAAQPLVDMLWSRAWEANPTDTPERRAAFEARLLGEIGGIGDETVRRHYRDAIGERLTAAFARPAASAERDRFRRGSRGAGRSGALGGDRLVPDTGRLRASHSLARHPLFTPRLAISPREALILAALHAHPGWLEAHGEELAHFDCTSSDAEALRSGLVDALAHAGDGAELAEALARLAESPALPRLQAAVRPGDRWTLVADADFLAVGDTLRQAMALHRRARTLHSELLAAERTLAEGGDETTVAWIRDIKAQLSALEGAEADIDGGASGRRDP